MPSGIGLVKTRRAVVFDGDRPLKLGSGAEVNRVEVAYETYGELNEERSNAVFICHALSGDAHAAGIHEGDDPDGEPHAHAQKQPVGVRHQQPAGDRP